MSKYKDVTDLKKVFKCGMEDGDNIQVTKPFIKEFTGPQNRKFYVSFEKDDWYKVIDCFYDEKYKTNSIHLKKIATLGQPTFVFDFKLENETLKKSLDEFFEHFTKPERHTYTLGAAIEEEEYAVADPVDPVIFETVAEANANGPGGGKKRKTRRKPLKRKSRKTIRKKRKTLRKRK
jgi:hypothetical protein